MDYNCLMDRKGFVSANTMVEMDVKKVWHFFEMFGMESSLLLLFHIYALGIEIIQPDFTLVNYISS